MKISPDAVLATYSFRYQTRYIGSYIYSDEVTRFNTVPKNHPWLERTLNSEKHIMISEPFATCHEENNATQKKLVHLWRFSILLELESGRAIIMPS